MEREDRRALNFGFFVFFWFGLVWLTVDDQLHPAGLKGLCLAVRLT